VSLRDLTQRNVFTHETDTCGGIPTIAGPLWTGDLFDVSLLDTALTLLTDDETDFHRRVSTLLPLMREEAELTETPYVDLHALCDLYGLTPPKTDTVMQGVRELGHSASRTHFRPTAIRTSASIGELSRVVSDLSGVK
ncbi:MAG: hypothetical protein ACFFD9_06000, partial [Candidatus Thorarchaeota archaeon]